MHPNPNPTADDDQHWDARVLDLLVHDHPGLWSIAELRRLAGDSLAVDDSLARLQALDLIHRVDDCVFATRAAAHVHVLAS